MEALKMHNPENSNICMPLKQAPILQWLLRVSKKPLYSSLNRRYNSPNLCHSHQSEIVKLLSKQYWEQLLCISFSGSSKQKSISPLYFIVSTSGFHQCLCYDQAITMIYRVMWSIKFTGRLSQWYGRKGFITLLRVSYCCCLIVL